MRKPSVVRISDSADVALDEVKELMGGTTSKRQAADASIHWALAMLRSGREMPLRIRRMTTKLRGRPRKRGKGRRRFASEAAGGLGPVGAGRDKGLANGGSSPDAPSRTST